MTDSRIFRDLLDELKSFKFSKAIDAMLPTVTFIIASRAVSPMTALGYAVAVALSLTLYRFLKKYQWQYALAGLFGVLMASSGVLLSGQAKGYFISSMANSLLLFLVAVISLTAKKPLAIWLSHMSHEWPMDWYLRHDIRPAYTEVTSIWSIVLIIRFFLQLRLYFDSGLAELAVLNTLLSTPVTLLVLIGSYVYGIKRLKHLAGPSVIEFKQKQPKPWLSQSKGF